MADSKLQTSEKASVVTPAVEAPPTTPPKKARKSGCGCMLPMLLLLATFGFAPQIVTMSSLRHQVPALLMAELPPGVVIGSATAGWTSPMQLNDVMIPDDQGRPSLTLKHVTLSRSIWELAQSTDDLGTIVVEQPVLKVFVDGGVTNYDRLMKRIGSKKGGGQRSLIDLELNKGEITIREESRVKMAAKSVKAESVSQQSGSADRANEVLTSDPVTGPAEPQLADDPLIVQELPPAGEQPAAPRPAQSPVAGRVIAIIDLQKASFKSQKSGEDELVGELTAVLREPAVEQPLTGEFRWNLPEGNATGIGSGKLKLAVSSLPLAVLSPWLVPLASGRDVSGEVSFNAKAEVVPSETDLLLAAQIDVPHLDVGLSPVDAQSAPFRWVGDNLKLIAEGQGDLSGKLMQIELVQLRTPIVNADFAGTVSDLAGLAICDLTGNCDLDPAGLLASMPPDWADRIQFDGLQLGKIQVTGALRQTGAALKSDGDVTGGVVAAEPLRISADVQWTAANVMGFKSENALVNVDWSERQLAINPNRLPIGEGRWVASPRIEFTPEGRYLVFDGGPVFENVDFTQEMSNTWLRYVSPILGSATSIEGKFSLSASPARVAMSPPHAGDFQGVIDIHTAQVGPGPLTRQIVEAVAGVQTIMGRQAAANAEWMRVDEQPVPFQFTQGRVYHKDLAVSFGDVVVQSQGSVGLDETIDFLLTVPIPAKWTEGRPLLANLKDEVIPLQMGGTLDQPQLDGRALGEFGKRIGFKSAGGLLQQLIEKRLEKQQDGTAPPRAPRIKRQR